MFVLSWSCVFAFRNQPALLQGSVRELVPASGSQPGGVSQKRLAGDALIQYFAELMDCGVHVYNMHLALGL